MPQKANKKNKDPVFIVKPALKRGGLDYLHISLIALVIVLIALAFSLAFFKQGTVVKNCYYGIVNGTCASQQYNSSQVLSAAERILANYQYVNTSLSLLTYYSEPNKANVSYIPGQNLWFVDIPYVDPLSNNNTYFYSMLLSGNNLSLVKPFIESTVRPLQQTNNTVISFGVVQVNGKVACKTTTPIPVYTLIDPYAPGAFKGIATAVNLSSMYPNKLNVSYDFVFTNYSARWYAGFGAVHTQLLGTYLYCSSTQGKIGGFAENVSKIFVGKPIDNDTLYQTAVGSGLNTSDLNSCLANATSILSYQATLARFYSVVTTPQFIVNCQYSTIPETVDSAINYSLNQLG